MSTGISISSINRIKELAEEKKYNEALEVLDTQNLDKSINPQFLRISGEIFRENKRYYDCRRILLKAHQMAPQGNRIIFELIQLYLELGYFTKAQKYYEQYMFYTTPEDVQKDYVEYIMKKATGADVKELAAILIPILESMPEDKWNFEAVLLYHKMERRDMALEESRYILENYKESVYVQAVIDYIDDKLDVDKYFYVYPKEEQPEDTELFGGLIEQEEKILEADYLRMNPPEARIMIEAEDKDAVDAATVKEKKSKKIKKTKKKKDSIEPQDNVADIQDEYIAKTEIGSVQEQLDDNKKQDIAVSQDESQHLKEEREAALEKLLSKKFDKDKIKESAKQVANAVKEINPDKAKEQVKMVTGTVRDNVKKATDVLGEAVGAKQALESVEKDIAESMVSEENLIVDGIIESVLEPPKKTVGQVIRNEELDALMPDSLEAISEEEIAHIKARKEEEERLELEAMEATRKLEEEKKAKRRIKSHVAEESPTDDITQDVQASETDIENIGVQESLEGNEIQAEQEIISDIKNTDVQEEILDIETSDIRETKEEVETDDKDSITELEIAEESSYAELKSRYINDLMDLEENPLESLGFISVVHSDIDATIRNEIPDAADILDQIIADKEFYSGENSLGFESEASYHNHGFEVENYDFENCKLQQDNIADSIIEEERDVPLPVQVIFAQENVIAFEDVIPENDDAQDDISEETVVFEDVTLDESVLKEKVSEEDSIDESLCEKVVLENEMIQGELVLENEIAEEITLEETPAENVILEETVLPERESMIEQEILQYRETEEEKRTRLRFSIVLSIEMEKKLLNLKESR